MEKSRDGDGENKMQEIIKIRENLEILKDQTQAEQSKRYLKSPYKFYGASVPEIREIAKSYYNLDFNTALNLFNELWNSGYHEEMWLALFIMEKQYFKNLLESWNFLISKFDKIKTWDHVDELSTSILGKILDERIDLIKEVKEMSYSNNPWIRRISIVSTLPLIRKGKIELTLRLAERLVYDEDIYVQKGAGWMLREAGKKSRLAIREFILLRLDMKSAAFSYATEKMTELRPLRKDKIKEQKEKIKLEQEKEKNLEKLKRKELKKQLNKKVKSENKKK